VSKANRFSKPKASYQVLTHGTIQATTPPPGFYKVWCPRCDRAAVASMNLLRCPYDGQKFCPPEQVRTFR
jgi:hypothetical protein